MARTGAKSAILVAEEGTRSITAEPKNTPPFHECAELLDTPPPLPATVRLHQDYGTSRDDSLNDTQYIRPNLQPTRFAAHELSVAALDVLAPHLWVAGIPGTIRPLHRQLALDRQIVVTEDIGLHLLWTRSDIYLKPLPPFLLNHASYSDILCDNPTSENSPYLLACAHSLLLTYTRLILHPSDLAIAHAHNLLPPSVTYARWTAFCTSLLTFSTQNLTARYRFGELRLSRINLLYRLTRPRTHLVRGYFWNTNRYTTFLSRNFRWLLTLLLVLGVTLNAFQLALATEQGARSAAVNAVAWVLCLMSLVAMAGIVLVIVVVLGSAVVINAAYSRRRGRMGRKERVECVTLGGKQVD